MRFRCLQAHKQMVKLEFKRRNYDEMISIYKEMLTYIKSAVTRNYSEKVINKVLDLVSAPGGMEEGRQMELSARRKQRGTRADQC